MTDKPDAEKRERIRTFGEVFTPPEIVEDMLDMMERANPGIFDPGTTYLEPACGEGVFVLGILRRKFQRCRCRADFSTALASVWAMDIQQRNVEATIENVIAFCEGCFAISRRDVETIKTHVILCDSFKVMGMMHELNVRGGKIVARGR